ncbi:hypothetical protein DL98DRAFT_623175 [Cadophora sp. DSE1049]|nr:hypothetical protein DL98DRAFT_623175 [Cadophora sp. DSE1049]
MLMTFPEELRDLHENLGHASDLIDTLRRFGMPSSDISNLQASLESNVRAIDTAYNRYSSSYGAAFERGDTIAASAISSCNGQMRMIRTNSHRLKPRDPIENQDGINTGLGVEDRHNQIERAVIAAFEGLARRLGGGGEAGFGGGAGGGGGGRGLLAQLQGLSNFGRLGLRDSGVRGSDGDTSISRRDLGMMVQHLRDSWTVETSGGRTVYVSLYEPSLRRSERPRTGFIQVESDRDRDRGLGMGLGGWRGRFDNNDGLGRGPLGMGLGSRSGGSIFDR